jgi:hypothetical protein
MKQQKYILATVALGLLCASFATTSSAYADQGKALSETGGTTSVTSVNKACDTAVKVAELRNRAKLSTEICTVQIKTSVADAKTVRLSDIQEVKSSLSASDFDSLTRAVAAGTVKSRFYLQQVNHITDSETQSGTFYYDGSRAWVTSTYRGVTGSHRCMIDWTVGFGVSPQNCYESGSSSERALSQQWLMSPFLSGFPVSWSETYTLRVNSSGQVW